MPKNSDFNIIFENRKDAAKQLLDDMPVDSLRERDVIVVAVSEEGVEIADTVATALGTEMDILLSEPIYAPKNSELPIAIVSETRELVTNKALIDSFGIDEDYIFGEADRKYEDEVLGYIYKYRHGEPMRPIKNRTVILADESIETGITILVAIKTMIELGAKNVYVAAPVMDEAVFANLIPICDGIFCPHRIRDYISVEYYYRELPKPTFEEIERMIKSYE